MSSHRRADSDGSNGGGVDGTFLVVRVPCVVIPPWSFFSLAFGNT